MLTDCLFSSTYHADWPDGHEAITAVAVRPVVPAGVLPPLQNEHFTTHDDFSMPLLYLAAFYGF